jgi:DNA polymerase-3 subunit gamma/tau
MARLAGATAPLVTPLAEAAGPVVEAAAPVVVPIVEAAAPVVVPVVEAVVPVVAPVVRAVPPVLEAVTPVVAPVVGAAGPIVDSMAGMGPGPPAVHTELTPSWPADARHPDAAARHMPAPIAARGANAPVPVVGATLGTTTGEGDTPSGVPPGPLPWAAPSGGPGGLGESRSGGAGPSSLMAVLGGGVPGPGPAPGGVVHDRAARLTSLARGPGRLPG